MQRILRTVASFAFVALVSSGMLRTQQATDLATLEPLLKVAALTAGQREQLAQWAEQACAQATSAAELGAAVGRTTAGAAAPDALRMAVATGVLRSTAVDANKAAFLAGMLAVPASARAVPVLKGVPVVEGVPAAPENTVHSIPAVKLVPPTPDPTVPPPNPAAKHLQPGDKVETLAVSHTLNRDGAFSLAELRGKVVVLDFFATWCAPCRGGIADMVDLQKSHDDVQVVAVTRFYTRGMDFSAPDAMAPHGGKSVRDLTVEQELDVNRAFAKTFGLNYPIVFTNATESRDRFGVQGIPAAFVVGKDGTLLGSVVGSGEEESKQLRALVDKARAQ